MKIIHNGVELNINDSTREQAILDLVLNRRDKSPDTISAGTKRTYSKHKYTPFSDKELHILTMMYNSGARIKSIANKVHRDSGSVSAKIYSMIKHGKLQKRGEVDDGRPTAREEVHQVPALKTA